MRQNGRNIFKEKHEIINLKKKKKKKKKDKKKEKELEIVELGGCNFVRTSAEPPNISASVCACK